MNKSDSLKTVLGRVLLFGTAALLILLIVLYRRGVYDVSFIERPSTGTASGTETREPQGTTASGADTEPSDSGDDTSGDSSDTASPVTPEPDYVSIISLLPTVSVSGGQGYVHTGNAYVPGKSIIARLDTAEAFPSAYTSGGEDAALFAYMGHILLRSGGRVYLVDETGKITVSGLEDYTPAYLRDASGRPLFEGKNGGYYYLSDSGQSMIRVSIDTAFAPAIRFDSQKGYGTPHGELHLFARGVQITRYVDAEGNDMSETMKPYLEQVEQAIEEDRLEHHRKLLERLAAGEINIREFFEQYRYQAPPLREAAERFGIELPDFIEVTEGDYRYGYADENGKVIIEAVYPFACEFNENGLAAVANEDGVVMLINTLGEVVINPYESVVYLPSRGRRPAYDGYYLPDTFGYDNLGMFYFDSGMIRMRRRIVDYYNRSKLVREETVLVREDGSLFDIPDKYNLVGYSDGILLLERDGKYGYFDKSEKWLRDPVLQEAEPFCEGLAAVRGENGKMGVIDSRGNEVLPMIYDQVQCSTDGVILAYEQNHGWTVYYKMEIVK